MELAHTANLQFLLAHNGIKIFSTKSAVILTFCDKKCRRVRNEDILGNLELKVREVDLYKYKKVYKRAHFLSPHLRFKNYVASLSASLS